MTAIPLNNVWLTIKQLVSHICFRIQSGRVALEEVHKRNEATQRYVVGKNRVFLYVYQIMVDIPLREYNLNKG